MRCGVFHTRFLRGCLQWQATQGGSIFGDWQASLAKSVDEPVALTFATPQAAYANPLWSANFGSICIKVPNPPQRTVVPICS
jgi:hypothetical protein